MATITSSWWTATVTTLSANLCETHWLAQSYEPWKEILPELQTNAQLIRAYSLPAECSSFAREYGLPVQNRFPTTAKEMGRQNQRWDFQEYSKEITSWGPVLSSFGVPKDAPTRIRLFRCWEFNVPKTSGHYSYSYQTARPKISVSWSCAWRHCRKEK